MKRLCIYGDSLLKGLICDKRGIYHSSDAIGFERMEKEYGMEIRNLAMPTFTSTQILAWMKQSFRGGVDAVMLECGGNDADYDWGAVMKAPAGAVTEGRTKPEEFVRNLEEMISIAENAGAQVIMAYSPPFEPMLLCRNLVAKGVDPERMEAIFAAQGGIHARHDLFRSLFRRVAQDHGCALIELGKYLPDEGAELQALMCPDGMHPNCEGYARVGQAIGEYLGQMTGKEEKGTE